MYSTDNLLLSLYFHSDTDIHLHTCGVDFDANSGGYQYYKDVWLRALVAIQVSGTKKFTLATVDRIIGSNNQTIGTIDWNTGQHYLYLKSLIELGWTLDQNVRVKDMMFVSDYVSVNQFFIRSRVPFKMKTHYTLLSYMRY